MKIKSDFLVIGSGIAGLSFALKAAAHGTVAIVTKREITESATNYAQGGIATVFPPKIPLMSTLRTPWWQGPESATRTWCAWW